MQSDTIINFPRAGWLGSWIKPRIARAFIRNATKPKLKATPEAKQALQKKYEKR